MRHPIDIAAHGPARAPDGQPLCRGYDWTEPEWTPSTLREERQVGHAKWLEEEEEDTIAHELRYVIRPDGSALVEHLIEAPWGSGDWSESTLTRLDPGSWKVAYFPYWPSGFGSRAGVQIVRVERPPVSAAVPLDMMCDRCGRYYPDIYALDADEEGQAFCRDCYAALMGSSPD